MAEMTDIRLESDPSAPPGHEPMGKTREEQLAEWVMAYVKPWREKRDSAFRDLNGEYYRLWRGRWLPEDKNRASQRSRIVTPALSQALEMTVSEMEEAMFGREQWVDLLDDAGDPDQDDINGVRRQLLDDMNRDKVPSAISQCLLNGGLWGTLAAKVAVEETENKSLVRDPDGRLRVESEPAVSVPVIPIPWNELITDPEAEFADDGLGTVHETRMSRAKLRRQTWGKAYADRHEQIPNDDGATPTPFERADPEDMVKATPENSVLVTEWHGLVPARLIAQPREGDFLTDALTQVANPSEDNDHLIEAIVTIADEKQALRAIKNPFVMQDRSIVVSAFEKVPGKLNGRGVMEKGYNGQKALDAEVRTRIDVMALVSNPMMGADNTALPRGFDLRVRPGKVWLTNGEPGKALHPIAFQGLDPTSFNQSAEMERMVQMGTGAMDTATPIEANRRNETATGTSLIAGTFVKRAKRALRHLNSEFVEPLIQKIIWRRMQYDPSRYPADLKFRVVSTLGIVARELEQSQLQQAAAIAPPGSPVQLTLLKAYFDNTSSPHKAELMAAVDQMLTPDPEEQQMTKLAQKLELAKLQGEVQEVNGKAAKAQADTMLAIAKARAELHDMGIKDVELEQGFMQLQNEMAEIMEFRRQNDVAFLKVMSDANKPAKQSNSGE